MKKIWVCVCIATALISMFFVFKSLHQIYVYFSLDGKSEAALMDWKVVEKDSSSFALNVSYKFLDSGKEVFGHTELAKPYFFNIPSADAAIEAFSKKQWDVFYRKSDPQISSLQKNFPFKACIHAILVLGVFFYFLVLRKMIEKQLEAL